MLDQDRFLKHINDNYEPLYCKFKKYCIDNYLEFTDDIFQDTILKCYEAIERKGKLNDNSPYGMESYMFLSLKQNIKREGQYARVTKRDLNYNSDNINVIYEQWLNNNQDPSRVKLLNDLFKDYSVLYIMLKVEERFDEESFYLFKTKYLVPQMTYKKLQEKTGFKKVRQKVVTVKDWVKANISKEEIRKAFLNKYGNLL